MSKKEDMFLTEEALFALVSSIMVEMVKHGEAEALLIDSKTLQEDQQAIIVRANTLLTLATLFMFGIVETQNTSAAKLVVETWTSPMMQDLVSIAFAEEIESAHEQLDAEIAKLEQEVNKETNDPSSESSS